MAGLILWGGDKGIMPALSTIIFSPVPPSTLTLISDFEEHHSPSSLGHPRRQNGLYGMQLLVFPV